MIQQIQNNPKALQNYINTYVLKDIGYINYDYLKSILYTILHKLNEKNAKILPYFIFTEIEKKGKIDYTSLRSETIDFTLLNREAMTYYNYAEFSLDDDFLTIHLMQTKIGGMPIDKDIIKYTKKIPIDPSKCKEFMNNIQ